MTRRQSTDAASGPGAYSTLALDSGAAERPPSTFWCAWRDGARSGPAHKPDAWGTAQGEAAAAAEAKAAVGDDATADAGAAFHWKHVAGTRSGGRVRHPKRARATAPPLDEMRPGLAVVAVTTFDHDRALWCVWRTAERVQAAFPYGEPDAWGMSERDPMFDKLRDLGIAGARIYEAASVARMAAHAWLAAHSPETLCGCAWTDALAAWWLSQLTARGTIPPRVRPANTSASAAATDFAAVLKLRWPCSRTELTRAYRRRVLETHPDRPGGSHEAFIAVRSAYETALREAAP